jgi:hypothetical protein
MMKAKHPERMFGTKEFLKLPSGRKADQVRLPKA